MAIDIEAIKRKLAAMNSGGGQQSGNPGGLQQWKPDLGEYKIRVIPWKGIDPAMPFHERAFYFFGKFGCLTPEQFGKEDAVAKFRVKLFADAKKDEGLKVVAKQLFPKMYYYAKIIVRGQEDKGIQIWKMSKTSCQRLLGFFIDEDVGDFTDLVNGCDLKVKVEKKPNKDYTDTVIDAGRQCPAHKDEAVYTEWFNKVVDIDDLHRNRFKSADEIESGLNAWFSGGSTDTGSVEITKGTSTKGSDTLDELAADVNTAKSAKAEKKAEPKVEKTKKAPVDDDDDVPAVKTSLDDAFEDLMSDD